MIDRVSGLNFLGFDYHWICELGTHWFKVINRISRTAGVMRRLKRWLPNLAMYDSLTLIHFFFTITICDLNGCDHESSNTGSLNVSANIYDTCTQHLLKMVNKKMQDPLYLTEMFRTHSKLSFSGHIKRDILDVCSNKQYIGIWYAVMLCQWFCRKYTNELSYGSSFV